jgi:polysaccharide pyruvyl transferase CsaB
MFLINGYFGYGNYGDELLLNLVSKAIKNKYKDAEIRTLSSKNKIFEHFSLIASTKEMICLGGLFQDLSGWGSVFYYFFTIALAKLHNKPVRILAQGIGPLRSWFSKALTYFACRMADIISVRDRTSSMLLKDWNIDHYYGADLAWDLYAEKGIQDDIANLQISEMSRIRIEGIFGSLSEIEKEKKIIAVALRNRPEGINSSWNKKLITKIIEELEDSSVLLIDVAEEDLRINQSFRDIFSYTKKSKTQKCLSINARNYNPQELIYLLRNYCHTIIGMRLHILILAHLAGLKITAIPVDPKINEFDHQVDIYNLETLKERAEKHYEKVLFLDL